MSLDREVLRVLRVDGRRLLMHVHSDTAGRKPWQVPDGEGLSLNHDDIWCAEALDKALGGPVRVDVVEFPSGRVWILALKGARASGTLEVLADDVERDGFWPVVRRLLERS